VEDFGLVEADFQQYYHLNLNSQYRTMVAEGIGFLRYARLFENLPAISRIMVKYNPSGSWSWENEAQSRILMKISEVADTLYNTNRKKGAKPAKPDKQFQPEYVEKAKKDYLKWQKKQQNDKEDSEAMKLFWQSRNPEVKVV
jgi:hypothetical protein